MTHARQPSDVDCVVLIVTYNSATDIDGLLDSLPSAADGLTLRVIVVDNGSADQTVEKVRERSEVICVEAGANLGYAGGINVGRQHAGQYRSLAILNPDLVLEPGALRELHAAVSDPQVGIAVPMLLNSSASCYPSLRYEPTVASAIGEALFGGHFTRRPSWLSDTIRDEQAYGHPHPVDWAGGAALLISADCDRTVGAWDEEFFLYMEEVDFAARTRAAGFRIQYVPQARAIHRGAGSGQSPSLCALMAVNRVRYYERNGRRPQAFRAAVLLHELLRSRDPSHRAALRAVARRSAWGPLISGLKSRSAAASLAASATQVQVKS